MNNDFVMNESNRLAEMLIDRHSSDERARVRLAFERAFAREPSAGEIERALGLVSALGAGGGESEVASWSGWCQAIFASAEFRYLR